MSNENRIRILYAQFVQQLWHKPIIRLWASVRESGAKTPARWC